MSVRSVRALALGVVLTMLLVPALAWAQHPSVVVGFNGPPIDDEATSQEMFKIPEWSGSTVNYVLANTPGTYDNNAAFRASGFGMEGVASMEVIFRWVDTNDADAWVRLTTFGGPERPNPSLDSRGKIRFNILNRSELFRGNVGLCIGVRETGAVVPQLFDGGTSGDIEWVGVDTTSNGITAGADMIVDTTAHANDVQVYAPGTDIGSNGLGLPTGTAVIEPGPDDVLDTVVTTNDDEIRFGYFISSDGLRTPIPALIVPVENNHQEFEIDLATGDITHSWDHDNNPGTPYQTTVIDAGITGMTGNGILDAANDRGTLEHLAFTNVTTDTAVIIDVGIDELQFEATVPDPVLPPTVVAPIIADQVNVTVTDLMATVNQVTLYRDANLVEARDVATPDDVIFDLGTDGAVTGEAFTATQRDSVTGIVSAPSDAVIVLAEPSPYTFSIVVDEDGDSCSYDPPGGWEFVGVTGLDAGSGFLYPRGAHIFNDNAVWQNVDVSLDDPNNVAGWLGGNGVLDPSPTSLYSIDSVWFTLAPGATAGPNEVFIDAIQLLDATDTVLAVIQDMEDGANLLSRARGQSSTPAPSSSGLSGVASYDGQTSHRVIWTYPSTTDESLGLYYGLPGYQCGTTQTFDHAGAKVRFHLLARSEPINAEPLPEVAAPIIVGNQDTVRILNDDTALEVQLYIDGNPEGAPAVPGGAAFVDFSGLSLTPGQSVSATQTLPGRATSDFAYPRGVSDGPLPPTVQAPIAPGVSEVTVSDVLDSPYATASEVKVYVGGIERGSATPSGPSVLVPLSVTLGDGNVITATQTVNTEISAPSDPVTVGFPAPVFYMAPAQGDPTVRVMDLVPGVDNVTVTVNGTTDFSATPGAGETYVDVPVSGLVMGDTMVAVQGIGGVNSVPSESETVTTDVTTVVLNPCETFETYGSQGAMELVWTQSGTTPAQLATDRNTTCPSGSQSVRTPAGNSWMSQSITPTTPSATEPVVFNVNLYDSVGVDPAGQIVQWAELNYFTGGGSSFYIHIGILGWADTDNVHYDFRVVGSGGPNWLDLEDYDGPERSVGWHNFTVVHKGDRLDAYVDGLLAKKNVTINSAPTYGRADIGGGYTSGADVWFDDLCVETGPAKLGCIAGQPPAPPTIQSPITDGDLAVTVAGVDLDVIDVSVYDATATLIGSVVSPTVGTDGLVEVPLLRALVHLEAITAVATNAVGPTSSDPLEVGNGNGDISVCIGIRETGDAGPLGSEGGTIGDIEWVGATAVVNGAPQGTLVSPGTTWLSLVFDPTGLNIQQFTGDGTIDGTRGTLEHLAVSVNAASGNRSAGPYRMYVDNVVNVQADGGADFVITDFEGYALGDEVLLQEPTNSGSTDIHLAPLPSASEATNHYGNPGQSEILVWYWNDTTDQRWARITTSAVANVSRPIIDLTKPISLDILLLAECSTVKGDMDGDCDIGLDDVAAFETCMSGPVTSADLTCGCADANNNGRVDLGDFAAIQRDYSDGVAIPGCTP